MLEGIIFDADGPLLDSFIKQFGWYSHWADINNVEFPYDMDTIETFREKYSLLQNTLGPEKCYHGFGLPADMSNTESRVWQEFEHFNASWDINLIKGMDKVVKDLWLAGSLPLDGSVNRRTRMLINTTNSWKTVSAVLEKNNLIPYFDSHITSEDMKDVVGVGDAGGVKKPSKVSLAISLGLLGLTGEKVIHIGDTLADLIASHQVTLGYTGKHVNLTTIGCTWGYDSKKLLKKGAKIPGRGSVHFTHLVDTPAQLYATVMSYMV